MAKAPNSVIGIDLGRYALKSVLLQRRGPDRFILTHYASRPLAEPVQDAGQLSRELRGLFEQMGGTAKVCAVGVSIPEAIIRIIEQPETPTKILRDALRLNGMALLNQDCESFVLDCGRIDSSDGPPASGQGPVARHKYLVGGLPRTHVAQVTDAFGKSNTGIGSLQLAPVCAFNAFAFAKPDIFRDGAFFLVDIGHTNSTMMAGVKRELVLVRTIDFGGQALIETLMALSGEGRGRVIQALEQEDERMVESARMALTMLTREIGSSIGFFEARREETISRIHVSGAPARSRTLLKVMSEEAHMPCESWNALANCEIMVAAEKREHFNEDALDLNVACGAAAQLLTSNWPMTLHLNLYHEAERKKAAQARDPLKLSMFGLGFVAVLFAGYYVWQLGVMTGLSHEMGRMKADFEKVDPQAKAAQKRADELAVTLKTSDTLVRRIEGRFYWAPILDQLAQIVPREVQITKLSGDVQGDARKKCTLMIDGLAAGFDPRRVAEDFRTSLAEELGKRYANVTSSFRSLEDGTEMVKLDDKRCQTATFAINIQLTTGEDENGTVSTPRRTKKK